MIIHVVQSGDTLYSLSQTYGVSVSKIVQDNGLEDIDYLVEGQTIVIVYPEQTYTVRQGDTLSGIAENHGVTLIGLLRNNPFLSDRIYIYPGETLVIRYGNKIRDIATNGYAYPFIDMAVLRKTLPFLTYLTVFNYRAIAGGEITDIGIDDTAVIQTAKAYGVAPIMLLTTLSGRGEANLEVAFSILTDQAIQDRLIENLLNLLETKSYYGLNISFQYINASTLSLYENFLTNITTHLNGAGYPVFVTINPNITFTEDEITFERVDYTRLGQIANAVTILSFDWGYTLGPPIPFSANKIREFLDYIVSQIPPEKIFIGMPVIGYDWELPYVEGQSRAHSLSTDAAIRLADELGIAIQYSESSQSPYFFYRDPITGRDHMVWFKDARSINALLSLITEYGFTGIGIWNIMQFFTQMWLIINSQYEIETILTYQGSLPPPAGGN